MLSSSYLLNIIKIFKQNMLLRREVIAGYTNLDAPYKQKVV